MRRRSSPSGGAAIDATPEWLKSFAIRTFGSNDKTVLLAGIGVVLALVAASIGAIAMRWPRAGYAGLAVFGLIGVAAALTRPTARPVDAFPSVVGGLAGGWMLWIFLRSALRRNRPATRAGRHAREARPPAP